MDEVIPELRQLEEPYEVYGANYLDGGTIGVLIVDQRGIELALSLPAPLGEDDPYKRLFTGAMHYTQDGAVEVENPYHSILRIGEILRNTPGPNRDIDVAIAYASGRWRDYWRVIRRIYITHAYKDDA